MTHCNKYKINSNIKIFTNTLKKYIAEKKINDRLFYWKVIKTGKSKIYNGCGNKINE